MTTIKKVLGTFFLVTFLFLIGNLNAQASQYIENPSSDIDLSYNAYEKLIEEEILGSDVSYDYWVEVNTRHLGIENSFELLNARAVSYKKGDILITNSTIFFGITGHTGIVIESDKILHTSGRKDEPYPDVLTIAQWNKRYPQTKVARPNSSSLGESAAAKAVQYFHKKKINYMITPNPTDLSNTYCSELVWYSYYKAGKDFKVYSNLDGKYTRPSIIAPYDFLGSLTLSYNGFKLIDNQW